MLYKLGKVLRGFFDNGSGRRSTTSTTGGATHGTVGKLRRFLR